MKQVVVSTTSGAAAVAFLSFALAGVATAAEIEQLPRANVYQFQNELPFGDAGVWRLRTQLIWDNSRQSLIRVPYRIWDPKASDDLVVTWIPDGSPNRDEFVTGLGTLRWLSRDSPSYSRGAVMAEYRGSMHRGMAEGFGRYVDRSGLVFVGNWREGRMDGAGRIIFPNGDQYTGHFKAGHLHGYGEYIDSTGEFFSGGFASGRRDGFGKVIIPRIHTYEAAWYEGNEVPKSRISNSGSGAAELAHNKLKVGVLLDPQQALVEEAGADVAYKAERAVTGLRIMPSNQRLMDVWLGRTSIALRDEEAGLFEYARHTFLGKKLSEKSVPIIFELENNSTEAVSVVGAYLQVAESRRQPRPALHAYAEGGPGSCGSGVHSFLFENFGWTKVENPRMSFIFGARQTGGDRLTVERALETFTDTANVSLSAYLEELGVSKEIIEKGSIQCESDDTAKCLQVVKRNQVLGRLSELARFEGDTLVVPAEGKLRYRWIDYDSSVKTEEVEFYSGDLPLAIYNFQAECGEGGVPGEIYHTAFQFRTTGTGYQIPIPLADLIPAHVTGRWRIRLAAPETSLHDFSIVILLSDGRSVISQPVNVLLFAPKEIDPAGIAAIDTDSK